MSSPSRGPLALTTLALAVLVGCAAAPPAAAPSPPSSPASSLASAPVSVPPSTRPIPPPSSSPAAPAAAEGATTSERFARWVADFRATARQAGVDEATLRSALDEVRYLPQVVEADRAQPELLKTVWDYLDRAVTPSRVALGQKKLGEVRALAEAAATRYGVPASILVAIWGMESDYGANYGNIPIPDALATLGFEGRREDWARGQLLAALKILQSGDIDRARMVGSWAGAMGQTQFLPSVFLAHAVDGDGDGRRDLWGSMADVLPSTANFLRHSGWQAGQRWGTEVRLPAGFDHGRAQSEVRQSSTQWAAEGLQAMDGAALPAFPDAEILLPAGARGPAFLIGSNFRAILRYNNSNSYALGVSLLAQGIDRGPGVQARWPRELPALTRQQVLALQTALNQRGFDAGAVDGLLGPATSAGLRRFQRTIGLPADGYPVPELLQRLQVP
ncbi:MAG: lytic murein transglycosylase [Pseudomonadota bacterium]